MKWEKIATIKFQAGATFEFTSGRTRPRFETVAVFLGPKRILRCGCGKTYFHKPDEMDTSEEACVHIRALYGNGTIDDRDLGLPPHKFGKVYLTPLGKEMFAWRHVAKALE